MVVELVSVMSVLLSTIVRCIVLEDIIKIQMDVSCVNVMTLAQLELVQQFVILILVPLGTPPVQLLIVVNLSFVVVVHLII